MDIYLPVPESVVTALRVPETDVQAELLAELAVALYAQSLLPFGKAQELSGLSRLQFAALLAKRRVARHYGNEELEDDLHYAHGE